MALKKKAPGLTAAAQPRDFSATETAILEAYVLLCYQHGVTGIRLQMVAKKAKVAFGTVHYYFGGDEKSLEESAISYVGAAGQKYIADYLARASTAPGYRGIEEYLIGSFQWLRDCRPHMSYWLHFYYLASINSGLRAKNTPFLLGARQRIQKLLCEGVALGTLPELNNLEELARKINALLFGSGWVAMCDPSKNAVEEQQKLALSAMNAVINSHAVKKRQAR